MSAGFPRGWGWDGIWGSDPQTKYSNTSYDNQSTSVIPVNSSSTGSSGISGASVITSARQPAHNQSSKQTSFSQRSVDTPQNNASSSITSAQQSSRQFDHSNNHIKPIMNGGEQLSQSNTALNNYINNNGISAVQSNSSIIIEPLRSNQIRNLNPIHHQVNHNFPYHNTYNNNFHNMSNDNMYSDQTDNFNNNYYKGNINRNNINNNNILANPNFKRNPNLKTFPTINRNMNASNDNYIQSAGKVGNINTKNINNNNINSNNKYPVKLSKNNDTSHNVSNYNKRKGINTSNQVNKKNKVSIHELSTVQPPTHALIAEATPLLAPGSFLKIKKSEDKKMNSVAPLVVPLYKPPPPIEARKVNTAPELPTVIGSITNLSFNHQLNTVSSISSTPDILQANLTKIIVSTELRTTEPSSSQLERSAISTLTSSTPTTPAIPLPRKSKVPVRSTVPVSLPVSSATHEPSASNIVDLSSSDTAENVESISKSAFHSSIHQSNDMEHTNTVKASSSIPSEDTFCSKISSSDNDMSDLKGAVQGIQRCLLLLAKRVCPDLIPTFEGITEQTCAISVLVNELEKQETKETICIKTTLSEEIKPIATVTLNTEKQNTGLISSKSDSSNSSSVVESPAPVGLAAIDDSELENSDTVSTMSINIEDQESARSEEDIEEEIAADEHSMVTLMKQCAKTTVTRSYWLDFFLIRIDTEEVAEMMKDGVTDVLVDWFADEIDKGVQSSTIAPSYVEFVVKFSDILKVAPLCFLNLCIPLIFDYFLKEHFWFSRYTDLSSNVIFLQSVLSLRAMLQSNDFSEAINTASNLLTKLRNIKRSLGC